MIGKVVLFGTDFRTVSRALGEPIFKMTKKFKNFKDGEVFGWESRLKNSGYDTIRTFLPEQQNEIINFWYGKRGQI